MELEDFVNFMFGTVNKLNQSVSFDTLIILPPFIGEFKLTYCN